MRNNISKMLVALFTICCMTATFFPAIITVSAAGAELYVSPSGSDTNDGSIDSPFKTLTAARDAIRSLKNNGGLPNGGVNVYLRGGDYNLTREFLLEAQDSGTAESPITYRAYGGEKPVITASSSVSFDKATDVEDKSILDRIPEEARDKVKQIDLKANGITQYGELTDFGFSLMYLIPPKDSKMHPMLLFDDTLMTPARWPNTRFTSVWDVVDTGSAVRYWREDVRQEPQYIPPEDRDEVIKGPTFSFEGDRPLRWVDAKDVWLYGYWYWDWADQTMQIESIDPVNKTIKTKGPSAYGIRSGQRYYAFNLLEEIDMEGEYYLDRDTGMLYLYPPIMAGDGKISLCINNFTLMRMEQLSYVNLDGLTIEGSLGRGLSISNSNNIKINNCELTKLGDDALTARNVTNTEVTNCHVYSVAKGGIYVAGGDRNTLTPSGNLVKNNYVHHVGTIQKTFVYGISIDGVGTVASHNEVHDAPFGAIGFNGNDLVIEYNYIHDVVLGTDDCGAITTGRNWTTRGNIIRYNFVHNLIGVGASSRAGVRAVMLDDMVSGTHVYGNVFSTIQSAVSINGGRDNVVRDNIFINAGLNGKPTLYIGDWGGRGDDGHLDPVNGTFFVALREVPYQSEIWAQKYPTLANLLDGKYKEPWGNVVRDNLLINSREIKLPPVALENGVLENNIYLDNYSNFVDPDNLNFNLKDGADILNQLPNLKNIPFNSIGLLTKESLVDSVALSINSPYAFIGKDRTFIDPDNMEVKSIIKDGRTLVPVRFISESFGATVDWDGDTSGITVTLGNKTIKMTLGQDKIFINGEEKVLDVPSQSINDRTFVPLRALAEALDKQVFWDSAGLILISDNEINLTDKERIQNIVRLFKVPLSSNANSELEEDEKLDVTQFYSFEQTPIGFELQGAELSTEMARTGNQSVKINEDTATVSRQFPISLSNVVTLWMYDTGENFGRVLARVDETSTWRGMGVCSNTSPDYYVIRFDTDYNIPYFVTDAQRSKGWHKFQWDYTSMEKVDMYIDDKLVATYEGSGSYVQIAIVDGWSDSTISNIYIDDVEITETLEEAGKNVSVQPAQVTQPAQTTQTTQPTQTTQASSGASAETFSFESEPTGFEMDGVTVSTEQAKSGSKSAKFIADAATLTRNISDTRGKVFTMWIYDSLLPGATKVLARVDDGTAWRGVGIATEASSEYYIIRDSSDYNEPMKVTSAKRTKGWHKFQWDYTGGNVVDYYIDDVKVGSTEGLGNVKQIAVIDFWADSTISDIFVDDISIGEGL